MSCSYSLLNVIGTGAFGTIYRAKKKYTGEIVAIKMVTEGICSDNPGLNPPEYDILFRLRNAYLMNATRIIPPSEIEKCDIRFKHGIEMPLADGDLKHFLEYPEFNRVRCATQLARGLEALHTAGYLHLDLKPVNCLVSGDTTKIADFGLAMDRSVTHISRQLVVTISHRPPEIDYSRDMAIGPFTDIFSLGVLFAEIFMGPKALHPWSYLIDESMYIINNMRDITNSCLKWINYVETYENIAVSKYVNEAERKSAVRKLTTKWQGIGGENIKILCHLIMSMVDKDIPQRPTIYKVLDVLETLYPVMDPEPLMIFKNSARMQHNPEVFQLMKSYLLTQNSIFTGHRFLFCAYDLYIRHVYQDTNKIEMIAQTVACLSVAADINRYFFDGYQDIAKKVYDDNSDDINDLVCAEKLKIEGSMTLAGIFNPNNPFDECRTIDQVKALYTFSNLQEAYMKKRGAPFQRYNVEFYCFYINT